MSLPRGLVSVLAVSLLTAVAYAADVPSAGQSACPGHGWIMQFLTPEERMVLFSETHAKTAGMTDDQRQAYRQNQRDSFMAMSDAEKQKLAADLKAKWDALTPDQQAQMRTQAEQHRSEHPMPAGGPQHGC